MYCDHVKSPRFPTSHILDIANVEIHGSCNAAALVLNALVSFRLDTVIAVGANKHLLHFALVFLHLLCNIFIDCPSQVCPGFLQFINIVTVNQGFRQLYCPVVLEIVGVEGTAAFRSGSLNLHQVAAAVIHID